MAVLILPLPCRALFVFPKEIGSYARHNQEDIKAFSTLFLPAEVRATKHKWKKMGQELEKKFSYFLLYGCESCQHIYQVGTDTDNLPKFVFQWRRRCLGIGIPFYFISIYCLNSSFCSSVAPFPCRISLWSFLWKVPRYSRASKIVSWPQNSFLKNKLIKKKIIVPTITETKILFCKFWRVNKGFPLKWSCRLLFC